MNRKESAAAVLALALMLPAHAAPPLADVIEAAVQRFVRDIVGGTIASARRALCDDRGERTRFVDRLAADTAFDPAAIERQLRRILNCPAEPTAAPSAART